MNIKKIVKIILFIQDCDTSRILFNYLDKNFGVEQVIMENPISKSTLVKRRIKKLGLFKVIGQLIFVGILVPFLKHKSKLRRIEIMKKYQMDDQAIPENKVLKIDSINDFDISTISTDGAVILVNGTRIISKQLINQIKCPMINIHTGITPLFRGVHGGYWSVATNRIELFGTTLHSIDEGVDTGKVIKQVVTTPSIEDNFVTYYLLQYGIILPEILKFLMDYNQSRKVKYVDPIVKESKIWSHPSIWEWIKGNTWK